ncbi:MAG: 1-deoxy-D-xylulose-5-phosphate reductoisomerase [Sneathiellales bacterium]|nr:1-deoxy-D-xylulose-5-phosphate reductoisomerase [Sneathiellales bacterium]
MHNALNLEKHLPDANPAQRSVTILGSTGSVGLSTLKLIEEDRERFSIQTLTANNNVELLAEQAVQYGASRAIIANEALYETLKNKLENTGIEVAAGHKAIVEASGEGVDWLMSSIVGIAGLAPTMAAVTSGTTVALANKEALVCGGELVMEQVNKCGATLLPVDSEHNAIFQVFENNQLDKIERLILTASGGPFLGKSREEMAKVTREEALAHPNWDMGAKISIDSATMMNKGLEFIEAFYLFPVTQDQIEILVHHQSVIHSLVEYKDGSVLAQMGSPDMRTPISYALGWPNRHPFAAQKLNLAKIGKLTFEDPDPVQFPAIRLAQEALKAGKSAPAILNAANEVAVDSFLKGQIGFLKIAEIVEAVLDKVENQALNSIDDIFELDKLVRIEAQKLLS